MYLTTKTDTTVIRPIVVKNTPAYDNSSFILRYYLHPCGRTHSAYRMFCI